MKRFGFLFAVCLLAVACLLDAQGKSRYRFIRPIVGGGGGGGFPSSANCSDSSQNSPTGRNPIFWTCAQEAVLKADWASYQANTANPATIGGQFIKQLATIATSGADKLSAVVLYQATGDPAWHTIAMQGVQTEFLDLSLPYADGHNRPREVMVRLLTMEDWLYQGMTVPKRAEFITKMNTMLNYELTDSQRTEDSDQTIGGYFAAVMHHLLNGSTDATAESLYNLAVVGGLSASGENLSTMRNAVKLFFNTLSAGGEWIESGEYNHGTMKIGLLGYQAIRKARGSDDFPEITAWLQDHALRDSFFATPDLEQWFHWGDEENPRAFRVGLEAAEEATITAGILQGTTNGPYVQDYVLDLVDKYGYGTDANTKVGFGRDAAFAGFNGAATRGDRSTLALTKFYAGQGMLVSKDGWGVNASAFWAHWQEPTQFVDHQPSNLGSTQLFRHGDWAWTSPMNYSDLGTNSGDAQNGPVFNLGFFGKPNEYHKVRAQESSAVAPAYAYMKGTAGGSYDNASAGDFHPTWNHEISRSRFWLPSSNGASDFILDFYVFYAKRPQNQCSLQTPSQCFSFYYTSGQQTVINATDRRHVSVHTQGDPTIAGSDITWTPDNGDTAKASFLLPSSATLTEFDQDSGSTEAYQPNATAVSEYSTGFQAVERDWMVRIKEPSVADFRVYLDCLRFHNAIVESCTLVQSSDGTISGALIKRATLNDVVVLFNGRQGKLLTQPTNSAAYPSSNSTYLDCVRLLQSGYSVTWTSASAQTDVFFLDLDPAGSWTKAVDGGGASGITPSSQGVYRTTISGASPHTVIIGGSGGGCTGGYGAEDTGTNSIGFDATSSTADVSGSASTLTWSLTTGAGSNRALVTAAWTDASYTGSETCTYNGVSMTVVAHAALNGSRHLIVCRLVAPASGAHNVVYTFSGNAPMVGGAVSYTGVDQTTPVNTFQASTPATSPLVTAVIPLRSNTWTIQANVNGIGLPSPSTGSTNRVSNANGLGIYDSGGPIAASGDTTTMAATGSSNWGAIMLALNPLP